MITIKTNNTWAFTYDADTMELKTTPSTSSSVNMQDAPGRKFVVSSHVTEEEADAEIKKLNLKINNDAHV